MEKNPKAPHELSFGQQIRYELLIAAQRLRSPVQTMRSDWNGERGYELLKRYQRHGDLEDLDKAIAAYQRAVTSALKGVLKHELPDLLDGHGQALLTRFSARGSVDDLENAIVQCRHSLQLTHDKHLSRPRRLNFLGSCLQTRFQRFGNPVDLESALTFANQAVELTPDNDPEKPQWLSSVAVCLGERYHHFGEPSDLKRAIAVNRRSVELTPDSSPDKPWWLNNLGSSLVDRFHRFEDPSDLESAVSAMRQAVELTPKGHPEEPRRLSDLAYAFQDRFQCFGKLSDLEDAIDMTRRALELTVDGQSDKPRRLNNLGISLFERFHRLGKPKDLEEALVANRRALELTPDEHPRRAEIQAILAGSLRQHFLSVEKSENSFRAAMECSLTVATQSQGVPSWRLAAAENCLDLLIDNPEFSSTSTLLLVNSRIMNLLPEIVWLGHTVQRRLEESARTGKLVNTAVSIAVEAQAPEQAMEWLEAGRSLVWSQIISMHAPLDQLRESHPDLAEALHSIQVDFVRLGYEIRLSRPTIPIAFTRHDTVDANQHWHLAIHYDRVMNDIRRCEGFGDFMRPKGFDALVSSLDSSAGCVVYINVAASHCDALVVEGQTVKLVPLPDLSEVRVRELRLRWWRCLSGCGIRERAFGQWTPKDRGRGHGFKVVLEKLWMWVVRPILQCLGLLNNTENTQLAHITWCPTGPLTQLPLHAAGIYSKGADNRAGQHIFDYAVSSYTPSLSALLRCRTKGGPFIAQPIHEVLVVTQQNTPRPGLAPLPCVSLEKDHLRAILSPEREHLFLEDQAATVDSVVFAMSQNAWVHLACHGSQNLQDPTLSAFELHDGPLTLARLMGTVLDKAELAFLSACQTATGDEKIPEESAHLAAGMLAAGFKGVVATMWSIKDEDAPVIVESYYKELLAVRSSQASLFGQTGAAYALHEAVGHLREEVGEDAFERWVPFVHFGV
ncbi:hypothetical protein PENSPDRAFT_749625 [Peniophora sp. CONT]|nr:hypothetical protein PENSPDRAFT_749625 [Peniophora sp. CONT]